MNKVIMTLRLTKDPDIRYTNDQKCIARFNGAVDRKFKKRASRQQTFLILFASVGLESS